MQLYRETTTVRRHYVGADHHTTSGRRSLGARPDACPGVRPLRQTRCAQSARGARLLLAAGGRVVTTDRLIEDLWAGAPPPQALGGL